MPPQPDLKAETKAIAATLGLARKKALHFALLIAKKDLVLETDPRKPVETLRSIAKKRGGGKGAWGRMRCEGSKLVLSCENEPPGNLPQLAKKFFSDRGQSLQIELELAAAEDGAPPAPDAPHEPEAEAPEEEEPSEIDIGELLQKARKRPFNIAWLIGQGELVLRAHRRKPLAKLLQEAKQGGGGPRGALGVMTVSGKTVTLSCEEAPPDSFPRLARKWLAENDFAYKVRIALPSGDVLESAEEEEEAAPGETAQDQIEAKLGRAFATLTAEIRNKKPRMSQAEQQAAAKLLQTYADSIAAEDPARALKTLKAMRVLLDRVAQPAGQPPPATGAGPASAPKEEKITFVKGAVTGKQVASQDGNPINALLRASKDFESKEEAVAYARSLKGAAAVRLENGFFAVYRAKIDSMMFFGDDLDLGDAQNDDTEGDANDTTIKRTDAALIAIITEDDYIIRTESGVGVIERAGGGRSPFDGPSEAFGVGMEKLTDKAAFEEQFELVMRDTAFAAIDSAEQAAKAMRAKLDKPLGAADRAALGKVLEDIAPVNKELADKEQALLLAQAQLYSGYAELATMFANPMLIPGFMLKNLILSGAPVDMKPEEKAKVEELQNDVAALKTRRSELAKDFPLALRVEDADEFAKLPQKEQDEMLREMADGVLEDIETTRENIEDGDFDFWTMPGVRETAMAGMGLQGDQQKWARERAGWEQSKDTAWAVGEAVVTIGLAAAALLTPVGWAALALGGASLAVGAYGAYDVTEEYFRKGAAADIALDPSKGLVPPEDAPHWGWVAASWIGLGFDAAAVRSAVKALKSGKKLADAARILGVPAGKIDDVLRPALEGKKAASSFKAAMMSETAFNERFGRTVSEAATVIKRNPGGGFDVEVVVRAGADPATRQAAVLEEMRHLQQLSDPAFADDVARLTEDALADWATKNPVDKMQALRSQLRLEADSQERLLAELNELLKKAPDKATRAKIADAIENAELDLESYLRKLEDVEEALPTGKPTPELDLEAPPRLFNTPQQKELAEAAKDAMPGIPDLPNGYIYASLKGGKFQVRRTSASVKAGKPKLRPIEEGGVWKLVEVGEASTATRRANILREFRNPTGNKVLDTAIDTLAEDYHKAYARRFKGAFEELQKYDIDPKDVIGALKTSSDDAFEKSLRETVRKQLAQKLSDLDPEKQAKALDEALKAMPGNRTKGDLFTEFRALNAGDGLKTVDHKSGALTLEGTSKMGDGIVQVKRPPGADEALGPAKKGRYLTEDKSTAGAFDPMQLKDYSDELVAGGGQIRNKLGEVLEGVTYYFPTAKDAEKAVDRMNKLNYHENIHVAVYVEGEVIWLR